MTKREPRLLSMMVMIRRITKELECAQETTDVLLPYSIYIEELDLHRMAYDAELGRKESIWHDLNAIMANLRYVGDEWQFVDKYWSARYALPAQK